MNKKMKSQVYGADQALQVLDVLIADSRSFHYMPMPNDTVEITVKNEVSLPEPLGFKGMPFGEWITEVERALNTEEPLSEEVKNEFFDYFVAGDSPGDAVQKDREASCV